MQFLAAVFLSGAAGLMYQTLWMRRLGFIFGNTALSTAIVLSTFFLGLALGGYGFGKRSDRSSNPLRFYCWLELGIAVAAVFVWLSLPRLDSLYAFLYRSLFHRNLALVNGFKFILTFFLLCLPSSLMGGTLPLMAKIYARSNVPFAVSLGVVYAVNTAGACVGLLFMGFVLIEIFGLNGAYVVSITLSLTTAVLANFSSTSLRSVEAPVYRSSEPPATPLLYLLAFASGAVALGYEVLWVRLWSFISLHSSRTPIGQAPAELSSTYVFSFIVFLVLVGISLGGAMAGWFRREGESPLRQVAKVQLAMGLYGLAAIVVEPFVLLDGTVAKLLEMTVVVLPIAVLMGIGFPLLASAFVGSFDTSGYQLGKFYACNTLGASLGPMVVGIWMLPSKGTYSSMIFLALANVVVGALLRALAERSEENKRRSRLWKSTIAGGAALAAVLLFRLPSALTVLPDEGDKVLLEEDNDVAHTVVLEEADGGKRLVINNYSASEVYAYPGLGELSIQIPASLLGRVPENILILCVGAGGSWVATLRYDSPVVAVDINPAVFRSMPLMHPPEVYKGLASGKMERVVADARNFLLLDERQYDLINIDPSPPITQPGMVNLLTVEFYRLAKARLKPGGILYQRFSGALDNEYLYKALLSSVAEVFRDVTVWSFLVRGMDIIASDRPLSVLHFDPRLIDPSLYAVVHRLFEFGRREVDLYVRDVPPVTDARPILEFYLLARQGALWGGRYPWSGPRGNRRELLRLVRPMQDYIRREPGNIRERALRKEGSGN